MNVAIAEAPEKKVKHQIRGCFIYSFLVITLSAFILTRFIVSPIIISGDSMYPTYLDGSFHFLYRLAYWNNEPKRGDVIGLKTFEDEIYIKRIVAMPSETVGIYGGRIFVNGTPLHEPHIQTLVPWSIEPRTLPEDYYFVIGDNRATSVLGAVHRSQILGKVVF